MSNYLSRFLTNMFMSGIITQKDGINYLWHNPFIFFPSRSFSLFYHSLRRELGGEVDEFFYWIGLLQGRNSTRMLKNRFGIKKEDIQDFVDGATIIGMGELTAVDYDKEITWGLVKGENSVLALRMVEIGGRTGYPVDHYLSGILAGGAEILGGHPFVCREEKCLARGDDACLYRLQTSDECLYPSISERIASLAGYEQRITKYYLNKMPFLKISLDKKFDIYKGAFSLNHHEGFNLEVYLVLLIDIYFRKYHEEAYERALDALFEDIFVTVIKEGQEFSFTKAGVERLFSLLSIVGMGTFEIRHATKEKAIIGCTNDILTAESKAIFGRFARYDGQLVCHFIRAALFRAFRKDFHVKPVESRVGAGSLFQVDLP